MSSINRIFPFDRVWSISEASQLACLLEVSAPKAGNVHPSASFDDMSLTHFLSSAVAIGESFRDVKSQSVGAIVLRAAEATSLAAGCNTNLGTLLLLAPLAKASVQSLDLSESVPGVLQSLDAQDSQLIYEAIRTAQPGGIGKRSEHDVANSDAPEDLVAAMQEVAEFDAVARQYTNGFSDVLQKIVPWLFEAAMKENDLGGAICRTQLRWLAEEPDGLIHRKCGVEMAEQVQERAREAWQALVQIELSQSTASVSDLPQYHELDRFLRADGHRRNPGTTADLIAAGLFVCLLEKRS